MQMKFVACRG